MDANRLVAHRGDNTNYPENTYASVESALKAGALFIELDIQMNASQSLIVFHDDDFKRMADYDASIFDIDDTKMQKISIHQAEKFDDKYYPTRVSHLSEVLKLFVDYPKARVFIEVKQQSLSYWGLETVMQKLLMSLENFSSQAIVISFSEAALIYTKKNSTLDIGLVFNQYIKHHQDAAMKINPDYMICPYNIIPHEKTWQGNWQWMVYSINNSSLAKQLLERGDIGLVETDDIRGLIKA
jgi:glycerophosphoryl diester phosphodiesterase